MPYSAERNTLRAETETGERERTSPLDAIRTDPTRMAQGIMTGIGFLGAGVIFKEGLTVRGLQHPSG
jgi:putative Mg2+ transporter-C (MgtC) family protein